MNLRPTSDCSYLLLTPALPPQGSQLRVVDKLGEATEQWSPHSRLSPVFRLRGDEISSELESDELGEIVVFAGPLHPQGFLNTWRHYDWAVWCTFGIQNLLISLSTDGEIGKLCDWLRNLKVPFEWWRREASGFVLQEVCADPVQLSFEAVAILKQLADAKVSQQLVPSLAEFVTQTSAALARAQIYTPSVTIDLLSRLTTVAKTISKVSTPEVATGEIYRVLGLLIQVNAGLSRFTSQSYSGINPVLLTECHFWSHSLLGTGTAVHALMNLARFLERGVGNARIPQRLEQLQDSSLAGKLRVDLAVLRESGEGLIDQGDSADVWEFDILDVPLPPSALEEPVIPVVPFYSARDGFRSTPVTLSAALASVSQSTTRQWSLVTVTHELSHNLVRGVLGLVYPRIRPFNANVEKLDRSDRYTVDAAFLLWDKSATSSMPENLLDLFRLLFLDSTLAMEAAANGDESADIDSAYELTVVLNHWHHEIEELMTHVVDFLYFYDGAPDEYIESIWLSWSTIPYIDSRIREYVMRSLSALISDSPTINRDAIRSAAKKLRGRLQEIQEDYPDTPYLSSALDFLDWRTAEWAKLEQEIVARIPLLRFTARVLVSESLRTRLNDIGYASGRPSEHRGFPQRPTRLDGVPIDNPLQFVREFSQDQSAAPHRSLWLLTMLAFNAEQLD